MGKKFSETESKILDLFKVNTIFNFKGKNLKILESGKPYPQCNGECKTDLYLKLEDEESLINELRISIKQNNADFLENKIKLERAKEIFGEKAQEIIKKSTESIKEKFSSPLVYINSSGKTEAGAITIGWKFELLNKLSGQKSGFLLLNKKQKIEVFSGINLPEEKRNSIVNGKIVENSGIANFILDNVNPVSLPTSPEEVIENLKNIEDYVENKNIYFACKAINYRTLKDKWDGNRPLAVYIQWFLKEDKLKHKIIFDSPLEKKANEIGENLKNICNELRINSDSFQNIKNYIDEDIII